MQSHNTITLTGFKKAADPSVEVTIPRELGPVRLLHEIGRGGMGVVYLGRHRMLDRDVAVKFLLHAVAGPDDPGFAGFLEGTRAAARVEHPGLTTIHHADVIDGIPYLVMQYIDGSALCDVLKQTGPLSLSASIAVLDAVSEAIGELHDREIVHRDIKPANILLDREGRVFVTDFGLACSRPRAQRGQTSTGLAGTPTYMAPEMFDGGVSLRSDVYALGMTSFELLTGKSPFSGTLDQVREKHFHQALPVELLQEQDVDAKFIEVIERATHKEAMYRYKTARHFQTALKSGVATEEVLHEGASELHRVVARALHKGSDATTPETAEKSPTSTYFARLSEIAGEKRALREPSDKGDAHPPESPLDKGGLRKVGAKAPPLPSGDQTVEVGSILGDRTTAAATLVPDVPCGQCGYNLRGLPRGGRCPECGEGLAYSVRPDRLMFADRAWLARIVRGLRLIHMTMLATPILFALPTLIDPAGMVDGLSASRFLITLAVLGVAIGVSVAAVVGVFLSTAVELGRSGGSLKWTRRSAPRAFGLLWPSAAIAAIALWASHAPVISIVVCAALAIAAMLGAVISFLLHLATLAERIPDRQLVRDTRVLLVLLGAFVFLSVGAWSATVAYFGVDPVVAFFTLDRNTGTFVEWAGLLILSGLTGTGLYLWSLLRRYRRAATQAIAANVSYETLFGNVPGEAAPVPSGDQPAEAESIPGSPSAEPAGASTLVADVPCVHCGYNLRGLPEGGRCPECGTPIAQSLGGDLLSAADPVWLERVYRGQALIYAGCLALVTYWFLYDLISSGSVSPGSWIVVHALGASSVVDAALKAVLWAAGALLVLLGAFATTSLDPRLSLTEQPIALRRFVRSSIVALVALAGSSYLVPTVVKQLGVNAEVAGLCGTVLLFASGLAFLSGLAGICYYLARLAMRIPDARLAKRTRSKVGRFVGCIGIYVLVLVWAVLTPVSGAAAGGSIVVAGQRVVVSPTFLILIVILTLVAAGYALSLMILMSAYRKTFRKCLLDAHKHAAST